jgi:hypothetical protein
MPRTVPHWKNCLLVARTGLFISDHVQTRLQSRTKDAALCRQDAFARRRRKSENLGLAPENALPLRLQAPSAKRVLGIAID